MPAATSSCFQLKRYWITGVCPRGAQVLASVGRSDSPDSSTKTITRRRARRFFSAG